MKGDIKMSEMKKDIQELDDDALEEVSGGRYVYGQNKGFMSGLVQKGENTAILNSTPYRGGGTLTPLGGGKPGGSQGNPTGGTYST